MNEPNYKYTNNAFSLSDADSYVLLIQIYSNSFSYAVTQNDTLLAWGSQVSLSELQSPDELRDMLLADYKKVIVGLPSTGFTLIPEALYSDTQVHEFARFLNVGEGEKVFVQQLDNENRVVYKVAAKIADAAEALFGLENTVFGLKGWVKAIAGNNPADDTIYAEIQADTVTLLYYNYGRLRYLNSFKFTNADELAYYSTLVADQLKMQPNSMVVCLSGEAGSDDESTKRLSEFFSGTENTNLQILQVPETFASHQILSLAALNLCG